MSNGDEPGEGEDGGAMDDADDLPAESIADRVDEAESALEAAETEADLDAVEATLDELAADVPDDEEELTSRLTDLRERLEDQRGPTATDIVEILEDARTTVAEAEWTDAGRGAVGETVAAFLSSATESLDESLPAPGDDVAAHAAALEDTARTIEAVDLDPDADASVLTALAEAAETLSAGLDDAQTWDDLTVRETLQAEGFYDRLTPENRKDFPPELSVIRIAEAEDDVERVLQALAHFESNFMEENILDALRRMGPPAAYDAMIERAEKRDQDAIGVLGKIGDDRAVDTLVEFIADESNPQLQKVTLQALGEIGSEEATQAVANRLAAEDANVRRHAARALGMIGDTRAIEPLSARLDATDEPDGVRAAAAWALVQIGTATALDAAAAHADDRAYLVQAEAEKARDATA